LQDYIFDVVVSRGNQRSPLMVLLVQNLGRYN
jgi:hypothetical protein